MPRLERGIVCDIGLKDHEGPSWRLDGRRRRGMRGSYGKDVSQCVSVCGRGCGTRRRRLRQRVSRRRQCIVSAATTYDDGPLCNTFASFLSSECCIIAGDVLRFHIPAEAGEVPTRSQQTPHCLSVCCSCGRRRPHRRARLLNQPSEKEGSFHCTPSCHW